MWLCVWMYERMIGCGYVIRMICHAHSHSPFHVHISLLARFPTKVIWMRRMRVLRRLLRKYREGAKIDKHLYVICHAVLCRVRPYVMFTVWCHCCRPVLSMCTPYSVIPLVA